MIGRLRGVFLEAHPPLLLLEAGGVGYEVRAPMSAFYQLPAPGEPMTLFTHLIIREDSHSLFGFPSSKERDLFRLLIKASGIGPSLALTVLSGLTPEQFAHSLHNEDPSLLQRLPGIGKKTAEKIVFEMRDKVESLGDMPETLPKSTAATHREALGALISLGYKPAEAAKLLKEVAEPEMEITDLIKAALAAAVS